MQLLPAAYAQKLYAPFFTANYIYNKNLAALNCMCLLCGLSAYLSASLEQIC